MRVERKNERPTSQVRKRFKGLLALVMAFVLVAGSFSGISAKAISGPDEYYLVVGGPTMLIATFFGKGQVAYPTNESGGLFHRTSTESPYRYFKNAYLNFEQGGDKAIEIIEGKEDELSKLGQLTEIGDEIEFSVTEDTTLYYGKVESGAVQMVFNGEDQPGLDASFSEYKSLSLPAGKYKVSINNFSNYTRKFTIDSVQDDSQGPGEKEVTVKQDEKAPETTMDELSDEIINSILTDDEKGLVESGQKLSLWLEMKNIDDTVSDTDKSLTEETLKKASSGAKVGMYFDVSFFKKIGNNDAVKVEKIPGGKLRLKLKVPDNLKTQAGKTRTFIVVKIHGSTGTVIAQGTGDEIPAETDEFSTYALAYSDDEAVGGFYSGLKVKQSGNKIKISWGKVEGATKYEVYAAYCGKNFSSKVAATTDKKSATIKKINGKSIDFNKHMKLYVAAYDKSGKLIGKSISSHIAGYKKTGVTNPASIKLSKKKVSVDVGKTAKIKATQKLEKAGKKTISDDHVAKFRYRSTNEKVATVSKSGKIKGISAGTCEVYVYTKNGLAAKVKVTVK